ncbi:MAG: hypothetical protein ACLPGW_04290 [Roseiarcus sp.]
MANFSNREDVDRWIKARPDATRWRDAAALASRAALRVWPLLGGELNLRGEALFDRLIFAGARANALAWAAAKYPARADKLRFAYNNFFGSAPAATAADGSAGFAYASALAAAASAGLAGLADASAAGIADPSAASAAASAAANAASDFAFPYGSLTAGSAAAAAAPARTAIWRTISGDATALEALGGAPSPTDLPL